MLHETARNRCETADTQKPYQTISDKDKTFHILEPILIETLASCQLRPKRKLGEFLYLFCIKTHSSQTTHHNDFDEAMTFSITPAAAIFLRIRPVS